MWYVAYLRFLKEYVHWDQEMFDEFSEPEYVIVMEQTYGCEDEAQLVAEFCNSIRRVSDNEVYYYE